MSILSDKERITKRLEDKAQGGKKKNNDQAKLEKLAGKECSKLDLAETLWELFRMRDQFHLWHLQTKSYEVHTALGEFYEKVLAFTDPFIEAAMASGRVPSALPNILLVDWDGVAAVMDHLEDRCAYWKNQKTVLDDRPDLANEVDTFILCMHTTMYKLTLK